MILNEGQPEAWRVHSQDDAAPTLYAERPPAILSAIRKKQYDLLFPLDFAGTLCARDGIKTGPHSPNGEDAYDRKLVVMKTRRKRVRKFFSNHQTTSDIFEVDVAPCMGASRNLNPSNNNPIVVTCCSGPQDHCAPTLNEAAGMSENNRPFIEKGKMTNVIPINSMVIGKLGGDKGDRQGFGVGEVDDPSPTITTVHHHAMAITTKKKATAVLDRCGNNWKNGKGGCGPLMHEEYASTLATMFQPFVIKRGNLDA